MSDALDRALDVLDGNETQRSAGGSYDGEWIPAGCVRCCGQVDGDGALCAGCRAYLSCETDDDPTSLARERMSELALRCGLGGSGGVPYRGPLPTVEGRNVRVQIVDETVEVRDPEGYYRHVRAALDQIREALDRSVETEREVDG